MKMEFFDIQEAVETLPFLRLNYRQLDRGPARVRISLNVIDELCLARISLNCRAEGHGSIEADRFLFLLCGSGQGAHLYSSQELRPQQAFIAGPNNEGYQMLAPDYESYLFSVPQQLVLDNVGQVANKLMPGGRVVDAGIEVAKGLWRLAESLQQNSIEASAAPHLCDEVAYLLSRSLLERCNDDYPKSLNCKLMLAAKIRDYLVEMPEVTLSSIGKELVLSSRNLRRIFSEVYGVSPGAYRLAIRLNQVREELKRSVKAKGVVAKVATHRGFWHMGRFCTQYRRHFQETPSETLAQSLPAVR